ncbi:MAG TPA: hypothetical protein VKE92_08810 [Anaerolineales bacterium]|nr:hypothetical protein [Anaerolineales bacterium]
MLIHLSMTPKETFFFLGLVLTQVILLWNDWQGVIDIYRSLWGHFLETVYGPVALVCLVLHSLYNAYQGPDSNSEAAQIADQEKRNLQWWLANKALHDAHNGDWYLVDNQQVVMGPAKTKSALLTSVIMSNRRPSPSYCVFQCGNEFLLNAGGFEFGD